MNSNISKEEMPVVRRVTVSRSTLEARERENQGYDPDKLEELYIKVEFVGSQIILLFYREVDGEMIWYYTATKEITHTLTTAAKLGNHIMLIAWIKDNFKDVEHKKITFIKGPNISKLWGSARS